jgi:hypothetical protein
MGVDPNFPKWFDSSPLLKPWEKMERCLICGTPVQVDEPGYPRAEPLCDLTCMKIWCAQTGSELLSMGQYAKRMRSPGKAHSPYIAPQT